MAKPDHMSASARKDASREATKAAIGRELMLVSILSRLWPGSHICEPRTPQKNLPFMVCLHSPAGPMLWRFSLQEEALFAHLGKPTENHADYQAGDKEALLLMLATEE